MVVRKNIPNTITLGNLLCGCLAIIKIFEGNLVWASCFVGIALILDFFDGFSARMLKVSSPIGKDLDSLADLVTFGVVPGMMMFKLIHVSILLSNQIDLSAIAGSAKEGAVSQSDMIRSPCSYLPYLALIIPIFSCIRLAKFNNDTRQSESFIGLNTPSNAMIICSFPLILAFQPDLLLVCHLIHTTWFLVVISCVLSLLLVSEIPFFSLKFKNFGWPDNKIRFIFLGLAVLAFLGFQFLGIPLVILLYILLSAVNNFLKKEKNSNFKL